MTEEPVGLNHYNILVYEIVAVSSFYTYSIHVLTFILFPGEQLPPKVA